MQVANRPVCVVLGVGPGNGVAIARRFAQGGAQVALMARDSRRSSDFAASIHGSVAIACDACDPHSVQAAFSQVRRSLGAVDTLVYNAGNGVWGDALTVSVEAFEAAWRVNTLGAFMAARELEVRPFGEKW